MEPLTDMDAVAVPKELIEALEEADAEPLLDSVGVGETVQVLDGDGVGDIVAETVLDGDVVGVTLLDGEIVLLNVGVLDSEGVLETDGETVLLDVGTVIHSSTINPPPPGGQYQHQGPPILGPSPPLARIPPIR